MRSFKPCFFFHCKATQFPTVFLHYGCLLWLTAIEWPCCRGRNNLGNAEQKCITGLLRNPISFFYLKISLCLEVVRFAFIWLLYCSECHIALKFDSRHGRTVAQMLVSTFKAIWQFEHVTVSSFTRLRDKTSYRIPWRRPLQLLLSNMADARHFATESPPWTGMYGLYVSVIWLACC